MFPLRARFALFWLYSCWLFGTIWIHNDLIHPFWLSSIVCDIPTVHHRRNHPTGVCHLPTADCTIVNNHLSLSCFGHSWMLFSIFLWFLDQSTMDSFATTIKHSSSYGLHWKSKTKSPHWQHRKHVSVMIITFFDNSGLFLRIHRLTTLFSTSTVISVQRKVPNMSCLGLFVALKVMLR